MILLGWSLRNCVPQNVCCIGSNLPSVKNVKFSPRTNEGSWVMSQNTSCVHSCTHMRTACSTACSDNALIGISWSTQVHVDSLQRHRLETRSFLGRKQGLSSRHIGQNSSMSLSGGEPAWYVRDYQYPHRNARNCVG